MIDRIELYQIGQWNYVDFGEGFLGTVLLLFSTVLLVFGADRYMLISVFLYWQMLMAGAAQSVVWYALCPLATPAQFKGDGGDIAVAVQKGPGRVCVRRAR